MDLQLSLHDSLLDLCMLGAEQDPHLCMTQQLASQPPYNPDTSMLSLVQLVPRLHALSNKSHELFENWKLSQKLRHIDHPVPAIFLNNAVFNVVARWLLSPLGDTDDEWTNELANEGLLVELLSFSSKLTKATLALGEELGTRTNKAQLQSRIGRLAKWRRRRTSRRPRNHSVRTRRSPVGNGGTVLFLLIGATMPRG
ncbi:hypothetical protein FOWG_10718 [Fusarium oxysporum f. sp. lycopersici MN25]|nr:hypothetical protein FOWG_10718 [Fusarium oxysporum f. sp. lycopersici MN25]